jgi:heptaprenyl diphosphate synthase
LLAWYSGLLFGPGSEELLETATAVELIHMASLIHDDLIDGAAFRRNRPTVHQICGNHRSVLGGDYLFAKAFGTLANCRSTRPLKILAETVQLMCQGEIAQDGDQFNLQTSLKQYYDRINQKTAVLLSASCRAGAYVCGADDEQMESIGRFGLNLGLAYQIIDDILDICGDQAVMGKPKFTDLIRGNLTLPILLLLEKPEYQTIVPLLQPEAMTETAMAKIEATVKDSGVMEHAQAIGISHLEAARLELDQFPDSPERQFLIDLTYKLQTRSS